MGKEVECGEFFGYGLKVAANKQGEVVFSYYTKVDFPIISGKFCSWLQHHPREG